MQPCGRGEKNTQKGTKQNEWRRTQVCIPLDSKALPMMGRAKLLVISPLTKVPNRTKINRYEIAPISRGCHASKIEMRCSPGFISTGWRSMQPMSSTQGRSASAILLCRRCVRFIIRILLSRRDGYAKRHICRKPRSMPLLPGL